MNLRPFPARARRAIPLTALALLAGLLLLGQTQPAAAQRPIPSRIAGVVQNGTAGADVPEGFEVTLLTISGGQVTDVRSTPLNERSEFAFEDLDTSEGLRYRLSWEYAGVINTIRIEDEAAPANLPLWIYEPTSSADAIHVSSHETIAASVHGRSRLLGVLEQSIIVNTGDRTFVPDASATSNGDALLEFDVPEGFESLVVSSTLPQGDLTQLKSSFVMTNPVPPGEHQVVFSYVVNYSGDSLGFEKSLPFGAAELRVLVPPDMGVASGGGLSPGEDELLGDKTYRVVTASGFEPGDRVAFTIGGLPEPTALQSLRDSLRERPLLLFGVLAITIAAMVALVAYALSGRRRSAAAAAATGGDASLASGDEEGK